MASFITGGIAPVAALERTQHLSGTFDFGGPISTLPPPMPQDSLGAVNLGENVGRAPAPVPDSPGAVNLGENTGRQAPAPSDSPGAVNLGQNTGRQTDTVNQFTGTGRGEAPGGIGAGPAGQASPQAAASAAIADHIAAEHGMTRKATSFNNGEGVLGTATAPAPVTSASTTHTHTTSDITDAAARAGANAAIKQQGPAVATELLKGSGFDAATSARMVDQTGAPTLLKGMAAGSTLSPTGPKPTSDIQSFMDKAAAANQKLTGVATPTGAPTK